MSPSSLGRLTLVWLALAASDTAWKASFARYHLLPNQQLDRSLWSMAPHSPRLDDRSLFGEIVFE